MYEINDNELQKIEQSISLLDSLITKGIDNSILIVNIATRLKSVLEEIHKKEIIKET